ncbi:MAG: GNAT family N-acetyltransferase [Armatimonadota bacterium]
MAEYSFVKHTDVPDRVSQVTDLSLDAFSEMDATPCFDIAYTEWFLQRPGCEPERCVAALKDEQMVSMALVTLHDMRLGGRLLRCGVIDSVATHPSHREKGLAHRLMEEAHEVLREGGADAAVVYTDPQRPSYLLFQGMGYINRAFFRLMRGDSPKPQIDMDVHEATPAEYGRIIELLDDFYSSHEGFVPVTEKLWSWRKIDRAPVSEVEVLVAEAGDEIAAVCTGHQAVPLQAQPRPLTTISDLAWRPGYCDPKEALKSMLAAAPQQGFVTMADITDETSAVYEAAGFEKRNGHVAMVLPLSDAGREALHTDPVPWYPMVESVIAV